MCIGGEEKSAALEKKIFIFYFLFIYLFFFSLLLEDSVN